MERDSGVATSEIALTVADVDTALSYRSGDVAVLATPRVLALVEEAACLAAAHLLGEAQTTVGVEAEIRHVKATKVGATVVAQAELTVVDDRKLTFEFTVAEGGETVALGTHRRVIVDRARFLA